MYYLRSYWPWFKVAPAINSTWFLLQFQRRFRFFSAWKSLGGGGSVLLWYSPHRWTLPGLKVASWLLPCCCPAGPLYLESNRPSIESRTLQLSTLTQDPLSLSPATAPASPSLNQLKCLVTGCVWNVASPKFLWLPKYYYYCKILEKGAGVRNDQFFLALTDIKHGVCPSLNWTELYGTQEEVKAKLLSTRSQKSLLSLFLCLCWLSFELKTVFVASVPPAVVVINVAADCQRGQLCNFLQVPKAQTGQA